MIEWIVLVSIDVDLDRVYVMNFVSVIFMFVRNVVMMVLLFFDVFMC